MVRKIRDYKGFVKAIEDDAPCVVDFSASWCGPCAEIAPHFAELAQDQKYEGVVFFEVDVDENEEAAQHVGIEAMPT